MGGINAPVDFASCVLPSKGESIVPPHCFPYLCGFSAGHRSLGSNKIIGPSLLAISAKPQKLERFVLCDWMTTEGSLAAMYSTNVFVKAILAA